MTAQMGLRIHIVTSPPKRRSCRSCGYRALSVHIEVLLLLPTRSKCRRSTVDIVRKTYISRTLSFGHRMIAIREDGISWLSYTLA